ncbi:MAG: SGNH/GDSL hydrolase family protein, partial [Thermoanaerobaculia bacterium]|nr:SGNH/GDSL hydrolase family protein [Thermoanaerobaculia bacterium]
DGTETVGAHRRELVRRPKAADTYRVLFLGASSVEGFPLPRNLTSSKFLELMLDEAVPDRNVEVINLGVTAVASFPVRIIGQRAIAQLEPDLVLVYAGHNELFGASGVASRQYLGTTVTSMQWIYRLRRTAVGQLIQGALLPSPDTHAKQRRNLIELMAGVDLVEPYGPLHQAARKTLTANLSALIETAQEADVPIAISTLVNLERGLYPIASWHDQPESGWTDFDLRVKGARELLATDPQAALDELDRLQEVEQRHAGTTYVRAEALDALGRRAEADIEYRKARDLDAMPWRAPTDRSSDIVELANRFGVTLVDPRVLFEAKAGGAPDWEFFYDHVHPSLRGQALLARAFAEAIARDQLLPVDKIVLSKESHWTAQARRLGAHPLEGFLALHKMKTLFETPPIGNYNSEAAERIELVLDGQRSTWDAVDRNAVRLWEQMSEEAGFSIPISYPAARAALAMGQPDWARTYSQAAIANAYPWSDLRSAARLALVESWLESPESFEPIAFDRELASALLELDQVQTTPNQPSPIVEAVQARLLSLAGLPAEEAWKRADELAKGTEPWVKAYLNTLPPRRIYERLRLYRLNHSASGDQDSNRDSGSDQP